MKMTSNTSTKQMILCGKRNLVQQVGGASPRVRDLGRKVVLVLQLS